MPSRQGRRCRRPLAKRCAAFLAFIVCLGLCAVSLRYAFIIGRNSVPQYLETPSAGPLIAPLGDMRAHKRQPKLALESVEEAPPAPGPADDIGAQAAPEQPEIQKPEQPEEAETSQKPKVSSSVAKQCVPESAAEVPGTTSAEVGQDAPEAESKSTCVGPLHRSGGPVWPPGGASSYDWKRAAGKFYQVPTRRCGLQETLWASKSSASLSSQSTSSSSTDSGMHPRRRLCGDPCVAHCVAGQPRELLEFQGLMKSIKQRLFEGFSKAPVVFAVFSANLMNGVAPKEGMSAFVRAEVPAVSDKAFLPVLEYMQMDRVLILREDCTTGECMARSNGFVCDANELGLLDYFDKKTCKLYDLCDVQHRRFQTCMHLVREYEVVERRRFDWVTRQRPDVYWMKPPPGGVAALMKDSVYVAQSLPWGRSFGGIDWFFAAPRGFADVLARFPDEMTCARLKRPEVLPRLFDRTAEANCETDCGCECFLAAWLYSQDVKFAPLPEDPFMPLKYCGDRCVEKW